MIAPQAETTPDVLYKFRSEIERDVRCLLLDRELYFASPADLNDPFDCYPSVRRPPRDRWRELVDFEVNEAPSGEEESRRAKASARLYSSDAYLGSLREDIYQLLGNNLGVLSLSATKTNPLLWAFYANNFRGFVVGYHFPDDGPIKDMCLGSVDYSRAMPTINPLGDHLWSLILATKSKEWLHEKEWRYLRTGDIGGHGHMQVPPDCIVEVCLGPRMKPEHEELVLQVARYLPDQPRIYKTRLLPAHYGLTFDLIN
jgi:hypothetical protein